MNAKLSHNKLAERHSEITITGSKSESNRLLVLQALYPNLMLENVSESDDTKVLQKGLEVKAGIVDVHHAGTAMRFLTAYFAAMPGIEIALTGSSRMQERPIGILVESLIQVGADISYLNRDGYPPLQIKGIEFTKDTVSINADVSSQYISALILIAPSLGNGLKIIMEGQVTSVPYIEMTLSLLNDLGVETTFLENIIHVVPKAKIENKTIIVESDWSSASYFYSYVALSENASVKLTSYSKESLQGDAALVSIYKSLGVETRFDGSEKSITLSKSRIIPSEEIRLDLNRTPDLAQTIAVTCFGLGIKCMLSGLHTLKIKETDRLQALKNELEKLGASVLITENSLQLDLATQMHEDVLIKTYQDHRMAMAFAPLACLIPIEIENAGVVSKSYPDFFSDFEKLGIKMQFE
ncbi:MAG: 3-phosphoshikimate 1-carboxyvinyltransferase [Candidatus Latescibacterota bacterium]|jgi:3-phosphoshikimate 1-carboxyvinyltransferase